MAPFQEALSASKECAMRANGNWRKDARRGRRLDHRENERNGRCVRTEAYIISLWVAIKLDIVSIVGLAPLRVVDVVPSRLWVDEACDANEIIDVHIS